VDEGQSSVKYKLVRILWGLLFALLPLYVSAAPQREPTPSPHGPLEAPCENCHLSASWAPIRATPDFNHNKTRYPLHGMHDRVTCRQCHSDPIFTDVGKNCSDCHADIHLRKFGPDCAQCHIVQGWFTTREQVRNHQNLFPLVGAHAAAECEACHKAFVGGQYRVLPYCSACHTPEFKSTTNPNHVALNFPTTCDTCHSQDSWLNAKFPHQQFTTFTLSGAHATLNCQTCHPSGRYKGTPSNCFACHAKDYQKASAPSHIASGFPTSCNSCHGTATWIGATSPQMRGPILGHRIGGGD
jgi:DnaJ-class molecular chaperone